MNSGSTTKQDAKRVQRLPRVASAVPLVATTLALVLWAGSAASAVADGVVSPQMIRLRTGDVAIDGLTDLLRIEGVQGLAAPAHLLVMTDALSDVRTQQLAALGVRVMTAVPDSAVLVSLAGADKVRIKASLQQLGFVHKLVVFDKAWKLDPALLAGKPTFSFETGSRLAAHAAGDVIAQVMFVPGTTEREAREATARMNANGARATVLSVQSTPGLIGDEVSLIVRMPVTQVQQLSSEPLVLFAEHAPEFVSRSNGITRGVVQGGQSTTTPFYTAGITGLGEIIGLIDDPFNTTHCSVFDVQPIGPAHRKLVAYNGTAGNITHGIHVATTLAGDDPTSNDLRGVAYQARMAFNGLPSFGEANVYSRFELHRTQGAFVHNNSWGNTSTSDYDSTSRAVDNFLWTNESQLLVFAVANLTTIRNPENAKNALAVGASRNFPLENEFCSGGRGPTLDGRRKPDVMAPGCSVISGGGAPCGTALLSGTSMACPAVSGLAAMMRQYFVRGFYPSGNAVLGAGFVPSGALLRAMIINSSQDMTAISDYPSTQEGWGRVLGDSSAYFAGDARKLIVRDVYRSEPSALQTGGSMSIPVDVAAGQELRVTLAFTDAPGAVFATAPVVNNLNLRVIAPGNSVYLGNVFSNRQSVAGGTADAVNSVEQVLLTTPVAGRYTIIIDAPQVQVGPQGYAIAISGDVTSAVSCDSIDFNGDGLFPSDEDLLDFFSVFAGGPCSTNTCSDIDFNNDGLFPSDEDILAFLRVLAGGTCD